MNPIESLNRLSLPEFHLAGALFGSAYGDALAAPTEFIRSAAQIRQKFPPDGPTDIHAGLVTDDTQMMLAVGRALLAATNTETLTQALRQEFIAWLHDPDNTRAPGMTCLQACRALDDEPRRPWQRASVHGSKGCGANMRVQPVAFLNDARARAGAAQLQAALTHGHPTALAAADLTAQTIYLLLTGTKPRQLLPTLRDYVASQRTVYHHAWLGQLWERSGESPENFISRGWDECERALGYVQAALNSDLGALRQGDPCDYTGEGWIAEEAWATALLCFLLTPDDAPEVLHRAAVTKGDSDSLACLAGAFAGAYLGVSAFPTEWRDRIEYAEELERQVAAFGGRQ